MAMTADETLQMDYKTIERLKSGNQGQAETIGQYTNKGNCLPASIRRYGAFERWNENEERSRK